MNYPKPENISAAVCELPKYISVPQYKKKRYYIEPSGISDATRQILMIGAALMVGIAVAVVMSKKLKNK